jgi:transcription elongation factor Elf1
MTRTQQEATWIDCPACGCQTRMPRDTRPFTCDMCNARLLICEVKILAPEEVDGTA